MTNTSIFKANSMVSDAAALNAVIVQDAIKSIQVMQCDTTDCEDNDFDLSDIGIFELVHEEEESRELVTV